MGQGSTPQVEAMIATVFVWIAVFFCVWKGVKSSSYVVWVTVPMPVVFIFIMVLNGLTLDNADQGIRMYLKGEQVTINFTEDGSISESTWHTDKWGNKLPGLVSYPTVQEKLGDPQMWAEACG
jgi:hypothetical protein